MDTGEVVLPPCVLEQQMGSSMIPHPPVDDPPPPVKPCPWGNVTTTTEYVSFSDVMSEQLATLLQKEENTTVKPESFIDVPVAATAAAAAVGYDSEETCDDLVLAQMLQLEFDKEHDEILKQEVKKYNGGSKVYVSFDKYLRVPKSPCADEQDEDDPLKEELLEQNAKHHWKDFEEANKTYNSIGKSGVVKQGNETKTKHDGVMCGRRNMCKLMELPSGIDTGDGFDMKLSNNVFNALRRHSVAEDRKNYRVHDKIEKATVEKAMDEKTRLILYKLMNSSVLDSVNGCISTGKEACVYHGTYDENKDCVLKVYKTTLNEFQNRDEYIKDDYRFRDRFSKQNPRKVIHMWAEKEMRNLTRMTQSNIPCPEVIKLKKHVLVMSFIGKDAAPAPKLKEVKTSFAEATVMYEQTVDIMKSMYQRCSLVHADLSEYNLLWFDEKVWVIDVSQSVEITHNRAYEFLLRDCQIICSFFEKRGVVNVMKPEMLFAEICGHEPDSEEKKSFAKPKLLNEFEP